MSRVLILEVWAQAENTVELGDRATFRAGDAPVVDQPVKVTPIEIGANTFIGANSLVQRGASIGHNCMFAGASIVRGGTYEGGFLYAGSPPQAVRPLAPRAPVSRANP
jgi:carbonic anhydrase/acetyltransferase-like protein (isoleucine patch superfamily)